VSGVRHAAAADAVFEALSDPTRRAIVDRLVDGGPATATELSRALPVTRQAVSKHLTVLRRAGLARPSKEGRDVRFALEPAAFDEAAEWMAARAARWDRRLEALRDLVEPDDAGGDVRSRRAPRGRS
jgi:DNA-binding transcriptional ArsR family regulator